MKEFGKIIKSVFVLRYVDSVELRQSIERQLNKSESSNRFSRAVCFGNGQEFLQGEKSEQEVAESCRRLIKNAIVCWNYLHLTVASTALMGSPPTMKTLYSASQFPKCT